MHAITSSLLSMDTLLLIMVQLLLFPHGIEIFRQIYNLCGVTMYTKLAAKTFTPLPGNKPF